jgi:hypothetical protein
MPFTTTGSLQPNPFVRILFVGLNILTPAGNTCQTFVHNVSEDHHLLIEVRRKRPGRPDQIAMRRFGPLTPLDIDPTHGFMVRTQGIPPAQLGVRAYEGTPTPEGTRLFDAFVLHGILDVEPGAVDDGGLPSISIDHGTFYTADRQVRRATFRKPDGTVKIRPHTPTVIGANIYRPATAVQLFWQEDEEDVSMTLEPSQNFIHEIYVINEPLFDDETPDSPKHDELARYFEILPDVPPHERYSLELDELPDSGRGTTRNPCMSILLTE